MRHMYDNNLNCTCEVCHCSCAVLYYRSQAKRLTVQVQTHREEVFVIMKQTKLSTFKGFKLTIFDLTVHNLQDRKMEASVDDAISQTSIQLIQNFKIQNNIRERLEIQK